MGELAAAAPGAGLEEAGVCPLKVRTTPSATAAQVKRSPKRSVYLVADCVRTVTAGELSRELNQISEYQDKILWPCTGDSGNCAFKVNPASFWWWASV